ncbi:MAG: HEAT repeat domain-containing protein [Candidatus Omnitrophica bacterium]|nr:HEAT repeat domain-containing protein [Candidatus Omnitrophota bacterium]
MLRKIAASLVIFCLVFEQSGFAQVAPQITVPAYLAGALSPDRFRPIHLRSISFDQATHNFNLLLDKGDVKDLRQSQLEETTRRLFEYFQIGLRLPNSMFWVNLRPDDPSNIIDPYLEKTELGKVLLEADLQLKKDLSACTSPDTKEGRSYWNKLYAKAESLFGQSDIEIPTITRPWIVPGEIIMAQSGEGAYVYKAMLKVMLEQDYLKDAAGYDFADPRARELNEYSSQLIRTEILPRLTRDVNSAKRYAGLRQVYYSLILAQWYKQSKPEAFGSKIDSRDLTGLTSQKQWSRQTYYQAYKKSFEKGEYNKEETVNSASGLTIRRYFSGGIRPVSAGVIQAINIAGNAVRDPAVIPGSINTETNSLRVQLPAQALSTVSAPASAMDGGNKDLTAGQRFKVWWAAEKITFGADVSAITKNWQKEEKETLSTLLHSYPRNSIINTTFGYITGINRSLNAYHAGELLDMALKGEASLSTHAVYIHQDTRVFIGHVLNNSETAWNAAANDSAFAQNTDTRDTMLSEIEKNAIETLRGFTQQLGADQVVSYLQIIAASPDWSEYARSISGRAIERIEAYHAAEARDGGGVTVEDLKALLASPEEMALFVATQLPHLQNGYKPGDFTHAVFERAISHLDEGQNLDATELYFITSAKRYLMNKKAEAQEQKDGGTLSREDISRVVEEVQKSDIGKVFAVLSPYSTADLNAIAKEYRNRYPKDVKAKFITAALVKAKRQPALGKQWSNGKDGGTDRDGKFDDEYSRSLIKRFQEQGYPLEGLRGIDPDHFKRMVSYFESKGWVPLIQSPPFLEGTAWIDAFEERIGAYASGKTVHVVDKADNSRMSWVNMFKKMGFNVSVSVDVNTAHTDWQMFKINPDIVFVNGDPAEDIWLAERIPQAAFFYVTDVDMNDALKQSTDETRRMAELQRSGLVSRWICREYAARDILDGLDDLARAESSRDGGTFWNKKLDQGYIREHNIKPISIGLIESRGALHGYVLVIDPMVNIVEYEAKLGALKAGIFSEPEEAGLRAKGLDPEAYKKEGHYLPIIIYVRTPDGDYESLLEYADGVIQAKGGWTSNAYKFCMDKQKPIVSEVNQVWLEGRELQSGDWVTLDADNARIYAYPGPQQAIRLIDDTDSMRSRSSSRIVPERRVGRESIGAYPARNELLVEPFKRPVLPAFLNVSLIPGELKKGTVLDFGISTRVPDLVKILEKKYRAAIGQKVTIVDTDRNDLIVKGEDGKQFIIDWIFPGVLLTDENGRVFETGLVKDGGGSFDGDYGQFDNDSIAAGLGNDLDDPDHQKRFDAVKRLANMKKHRSGVAFWPLIRALDDSSPTVRRIAAKGLKKYHSVNAIGPLLSSINRPAQSRQGVILDTDLYKAAQTAAVESLAAIRDDAAVRGLIQSFSNVYADDVKIAIIEALVETSHPMAGAAFIDFLYDRQLSGDVHAKIQEALYQIKLPANDMLRQSLSRDGGIVNEGARAEELAGKLRTYLAELFDSDLAHYSLIKDIKPADMALEMLYDEGYMKKLYNRAKEGLKASDIIITDADLKIGTWTLFMDEHTVDVDFHLYADPGRISVEVMEAGAVEEAGQQPSDSRDGGNTAKDRASKVKGIIDRSVAQMNRVRPDLWYPESVVNMYAESLFRHLTNLGGAYVPALKRDLAERKKSAKAAEKVPYYQQRLIETIEDAIEYLEPSFVIPAIKDMRTALGNGAWGRARNIAVTYGQKQEERFLKINRSFVKVKEFSIKEAVAALRSGDFVHNIVDGYSWDYASLIVLGDEEYGRRMEKACADLEAGRIKAVLYEKQYQAWHEMIVLYETPLALIEMAVKKPRPVRAPSRLDGGTPTMDDTNGSDPVNRVKRNADSQYEGPAAESSSRSSGEINRSADQFDGGIIYQSGPMYVDARPGYYKEGKMWDRYFFVELGSDHYSEGGQKKTGYTLRIIVSNTKFYSDQFEVPGWVERYNTGRIFVGNDESVAKQLYREFTEEGLAWENLIEWYESPNAFDVGRSVYPDKWEIAEAYQKRFNVSQPLDSRSVKILLRAAAAAEHEQTQAKDGGSATNVGGIDLRALPVDTQAAGAISAAGPAANVPFVSIKELETQWQTIKRQMRSGPMPYDRLMAFALGCCRNKDAAEQREALAVCITGILKLEEEAAVLTAPELKEILVAIS